jgi:hypothetical protein
MRYGMGGHYKAEDREAASTLYPGAYTIHHFLEKPGAFFAKLLIVW